MPARLLEASAEQLSYMLSRLADQAWRRVFFLRKQKAAEGKKWRTMNY